MKSFVQLIYANKNKIEKWHHNMFFEIAFLINRDNNLKSILNSTQYTVSVCCMVTISITRFNLQMARLAF
jgi:hypothetical protein